MMVQTSLREILPEDCILVGQSLNSDLNALKMMHPYVIDTSVIFNITGDRSLLSTPNRYTLLSNIFFVGGGVSFVVVILSLSFFVFSYYVDTLF